MEEKLDVISGRDIADAVADLIFENKGDNIRLIDVSEQTSFTDYFLIASAKSPLHLKALAEDIRVNLRYNGVKTNHIEGLKGLKWVLLDYSDVVIHLFLPQAREYYALEEYWADAPEIELDFPEEEI